MVDIPESAASPPPAMLTRSVRRLCAFVRLLVAVGAVGLVGVPAWLWTSSERVREVWQTMPGMADQPFTVDDRALWLGSIVMLMPIAVGLYTLWQLWHLFGEYAAGRVFSREAQRRLRGFSLGVIGAAVLTPVVRTLLALVLTLGNPPGQRLLVFNLGWDDYMNVLLGAVLLVITTVMAEAVRVAEDHAGFV